MIDVAFQLLAFFIITTKPVDVVTNLDVFRPSPEKQSQEQSPAKIIRVTVFPDGFTIKMDEKNHHLWKPVFIGEVQKDGQFNVVWKTSGPIRAQPWSQYIPEDKGKKDEPEKK